MDKNLTLRVAAVAGILTAGLIVSFYLPAGHTSSPEIVLPQSGTAGIDIGVDREQYNRRIVDEVTVDKGSVQRVVATLRRPGEYTFTGQSVFYYGAEQSRTFSVRGAVRDGLTKVVQSLDNGLYKHTILTDADAYIWSSDSFSYYKGALGAFTVDELALVPTYEQLLNLPPEEMTDGGFTETEGGACVYAEHRLAEGNIRSCYYISVETGLLTACQRYEGERLVYSMTMTPALDTVGDDWFTLPSGVVVTRTG